MSCPKDREMTSIQTISRLTAAGLEVLDVLWRAAREIEDAQTAAWVPFMGDDT
jgi:hypothetical protein